MTQDKKQLFGEHIFGTLFAINHYVRLAVTKPLKSINQESFNFMLKKEIKQKFVQHLSQRGVKNWDEVYVGISKDPQTRLFSGHCVDEEKDIWIFCKASSSTAAREFEQELLDLGASGGPGGGDDKSVYVYAYKMTSKTIDG